MAVDISNYLTQIQNAAYGKDVRSALYQSIRITNEYATSSMFKLIQVNYRRNKVSKADVWAYADEGIITAAEATTICGARPT